MARKQFNFILTAVSVVVQKLSYPDPDAAPVVAEEKEFSIENLPATYAVGEGEVSLAAYGLSQFLQDRTSSVAGDDKLEKMEEIFGSLGEGQWKSKRESTGGVRKPSIDPFFAAGFAKFLQANGKDVDTATATTLLQGYKKEQRAAIRAHEQVKAFIEQAKSEANSAASEIDLGSLLG